MHPVGFQCGWLVTVYGYCGLVNIFEHEAIGLPGAVHRLLNADDHGLIIVEALTFFTATCTFRLRVEGREQKVAVVEPVPTPVDVVIALLVVAVAHEGVS